MSVTAHAILLIFLPVAALLAVAGLKRRKPTTQQALVAALLSLITMKAVQSSNVHLCRQGVPRNQWLLIGPCLLLVLLFVDQKNVRRLLAALLFVGMIGLSCHFTDVVHSSGWTGNPSIKGYAQAELRSLKVEVEEYVKKHPVPALSYPAGWLRELGVPKTLQETVDKLHPIRHVAEDVWHSRLTGLYQQTYVSQDYWYPGGRLDDGIKRTELRDLYDLAISDSK